MQSTPRSTECHALDRHFLFLHLFRKWTQVYSSCLYRTPFMDEYFQGRLKIQSNQLHHKTMNETAVLSRKRLMPSTVATLLLLPLDVSTMTRRSLLRLRLSFAAPLREDPIEIEPSTCPPRCTEGGDAGHGQHGGRDVVAASGGGYATMETWIEFLNTRTGGALARSTRSTCS